MNAGSTARAAKGTVVRHGPGKEAVIDARPGEALSPIAGRSHPFLVLRKGWAARCHFLDEGRRQISALFLAGDLCDPLWLSGGTGEQVVALTAVEAVTIAPTDRELLTEVAAEARLASAWTVNLGRKSGLERLANLFCELFQRNRRSDAAARSCEFPLSARDLADATGLTVQHVQRLLADMRTAGLARLSRNRLTVPDLARLARVGHFEPGRLPMRRNWLRAKG